MTFSRARYTSLYPHRGKSQPTKIKPVENRYTLKEAENQAGWRILYIYMPHEMPGEDSVVWKDSPKGATIGDLLKAKEGKAPETLQR